MFEEGTIQAHDGTSLFLRAMVLPDARANVVLTHGMGEHSHRYVHVAEWLARHGFRLCTYDLRGHGRSGGRRGYIEHYDDLLEDLDQVIGHYREAGRPSFLYGHSTGGQITLNYVIDRQPQTPGVVIASPLLRLAFRPRWFQLLLARAMVQIWPSFTQQTEMIPARLSRDEAFLASLADPDLLHQKMSARMYFELMRAGERALRGAPKFRAPLLLLHGTDDPVTSVEATREFFNLAITPQKTLKLYPETRHETHNDVNREVILRDVTSWLEQRLPAGPA